MAIVSWPRIRWHHITLCTISSKLSGDGIHLCATTYNVITSIWWRHPPACHYIQYHHFHLAKSSICVPLGPHLDLVEFELEAEQLGKNSRERRQHDDLCDVVQQWIRRQTRHTERTLQLLNTFALSDPCPANCPQLSQVRLGPVYPKSFQIFHF